jgi:hypothetical protein
MQSQRPSSRTGGILSLVGAACALLGFFLPLAGPVGELTSSEWQLLLLALSRWQPLAPSAVEGLLSLQLRWGLLGVILTLPLLSALGVLGTSVSACFKLPSSGLLTLRRLAASNGLFIQSVMSIIVLRVRLQESIGLGFVLLLLGFLLTVVGAWRSHIPRPTLQRELVSPSLRPSRMGAILSLLGGALVIVGVFFFPMLSSSAGDLSASEWSEVTIQYAHAPRSPLDQADAVVVVLPLLSVLFVLATSTASLFRERSPAMVTCRRVAALEGLISQCLLGLDVYFIYSFGLLYSGSGAKLGFGGGFGLVLLGFIIMSGGTFLT